jgi:hypothetical protein
VKLIKSRISFKGNLKCFDNNVSEAKTKDARKTKLSIYFNIEIILISTVGLKQFVTN